MFGSRLPGRRIENELFTRGSGDFFSAEAGTKPSREAERMTTPGYLKTSSRFFSLAKYNTPGGGGGELSFSRWVLLLLLSTRLNQRRCILIRSFPRFVIASASNREAGSADCFMPKQQLTNVRLINRTGLSPREGTKGDGRHRGSTTPRVSLLMSTNFPDAQLFVRGP